MSESRIVPSFPSGRVIVSVNTTTSCNWLMFIDSMIPALSHVTQIIVCTCKGCDVDFSTFARYYDVDYSAFARYCDKNGITYRYFDNPISAHETIVRMRELKHKDEWGVILFDTIDKAYMNDISAIVQNDKYHCIYAVTSINDVPDFMKVNIRVIYTESRVFHDDSCEDLVRSGFVIDKNHFLQLLHKCDFIIAINKETTKSLFIYTTEGFKDAYTIM